MTGQASSSLLIGLYVAATSLGLVVLKLGSERGAAIELAGARPSLNLNIMTVSGVVLYGLSFLLYTYLIAKFDLGYIVPLTTALVYIAVFGASYFVFDEAFTVSKVAGIGLILIGLALLNAAPSGVSE